MKNVNIIFEYNNECNSDILYSGITYYESNKFDHIEITNRSITISGSRGNKVNEENILTNTKSTFYEQLLKGIVYVYLSEGKRFKLGNVTVKCGEKEKKYESIEVLNPCMRDLDCNLIIQRTECEKIFSNSEKVKELLIAMISFIKGCENNDFDFLWKAFNSLYTCISGRDKEFEKLVDMKNFIQHNRMSMIKVTNKIDNDTMDDIRSFRIREFILNNFEDIGKTEAYANMVKSFSDYRMSQLFNEVMCYREDNLKHANLFSDVQNHITKCINRNQKDNIDLVRFYVLKYAYFLRNKYFHAEKSTPVFVLKKNNEIEEIEKINSVLKCLLSDLFNCCHLYV